MYLAAEWGGGGRRCAAPGLPRGILPEESQDYPSLQPATADWSALPVQWRPAGGDVHEWGKAPTPTVWELASTADTLSERTSTPVTDSHHHTWWPGAGLAEEAQCTGTLVRPLPLPAPQGVPALSPDSDREASSADGSVEGSLEAHRRHLESLVASVLADAGPAGIAAAGALSAGGPHGAAPAPTPPPALAPLLGLPLAYETLELGLLAQGEGDRQRLFSKTRLCRFHQVGRCRKGVLCPFAHGEEEMRNVPDLTKTSICARWARRGGCPLPARECRFAHGGRDLRLDSRLVAYAAAMACEAEATAPEPVSL